MADHPPGLSKTTRLDTGEPLLDPANTGSQEPTNAAHASGSSLEMVISEDLGRKISNRYEITDVIGEGGMGVVYEAWDTQVERRVAIKLVRSDTTSDRKFLSRFRRELEITSKLRHPSTIRVFEHGETDDGRPYMVMELLTGQSLADRLEEGPLDQMEALQIARQAAESLSEAHEHGVFHRDLKPDNIFIETVGVSKVVKVLDFGIAGGVDASRLTQAGEVFGTPQYMSPEQCNGLPLDHRTDIYSLAAILYEMIEGRPPFSAETPMATMLKHVRAKVPPPRNAAKETTRIMLMGLRKDRGKRIQTAGRFSELIGTCMGHLRAVKEGRISGTTTPVSVSIPSGISKVMAPASGPTVTLPGMGSTAGDRRGSAIAIGLGVVAIGLVVIMLFFDVSRTAPTSEDNGDPDPGKPVQSQLQPEPEAKGLPFSRALVRTNVDGAKVLVDDVEQCETPCEIKVPVGDGKAHLIRLRKAGYTDVLQTWQPTEVGQPLPPLPDMKKL